MNELQAPATLAVIVATVAVSWYAFGHRAFLERWLFATQPILERREWGRLLTSGLLHGGLGHLFFNMYSLWSFAAALERAYGARTFLVIYFSAVVGGNLVSLYLHRREPGYRALGASGGVSGVIFATIFLFGDFKISLMFIPVGIPSWLFALGFVVGSYVALRGRVGNIGHDAHLGGALCGLAAAVGLFPEIPERRPLLFAAVVVITLGLIWHARAFPLGAARPRAPKRPAGSPPPPPRTRGDDRRLDELLEKVAAVGLAGLSESERAELKAIADRRGGR